MSSGIGSAQVKHPTFRDLTPAGQAAYSWFRQVGRALKTCRLYRRDNPVVLKVREQLFEPLSQAILLYGAWRFRITSAEIYLLDEAVVRPPQRTEEEAGLIGGKELMLPFLFYRDGIRGVSFLPGLPQRDLDALFDALLSASSGVITHDDLVTLMWQANTTHVQIDSVPVEQTIYLSSRRPGGGGDGGGGGGHRGQSYAWSPAGGEIRADIGQARGAAQGLHRDTFDDWPLPADPADVPEAYQKILPAMEFARMRLSTEWVGERSTDWTLQAPDVLRQLYAMSPGIQTRATLAHSVTTWLISAIQRSSWQEAQETLQLLREFDPDGSIASHELTTGIEGLDTDEITERLDESETDDQARFFALAVSLGRPALDLACSVMAKASKSRTRAAACTMLCYLCHDDPELLAPYVNDSRWYVARNALFVLGQIGGPEVVGLLRAAAQHPEPRVRRQVVASLGNVPRELRPPILLAQLDTRDPQLLAAALALLTREKHPEAARTILRQIEAPDFESRSEGNQRTLFNALAEVADDSSVPALEALLHKGGWFARRTLQRVAAARTLQRIGSEKALSALEAGLHSRSEIVRSACLDAMNTRTML
jgi:hypothetical protein